MSFLPIKIEKNECGEEKCIEKTHKETSGDWDEFISYDTWRRGVMNVLSCIIVVFNYRLLSHIKFLLAISSRIVNKRLN